MSIYRPVYRGGRPIGVDFLNTHKVSSASAMSKLFNSSKMVKVYSSSLFSRPYDNHVLDGRIPELITSRNDAVSKRFAVLLGIVTGK